MASVNIQIDTSELGQLQVSLLRIRGQLPWVAARSMTNAAKAGRQAIRREILPKIQGGPTRWTERGLIVQFAKPTDLRVQFGFQYGEGRWEDGAFARKAGGIPSGRYMGLLSSGGDRRPKSFEAQMRRSGVIGRGDFVVPSSRWGAVDARGNVPGGTYKQVLSRLRALGDAGSTQNASNSTRSSRRRAVTDYFMAREDEQGIASRWQLGAKPRFIAERVGPGPKGGTGKGSGRPGRPQTVGYKRGFAQVMTVVDDAPNYERKFDIQSVGMREYQRVFPVEFRQLMSKELQRRR